MPNQLSKISITLFTVRSSPLGYAEKLAKLREIGYQSIQGGLAQGMSLQEHLDLYQRLGLEMSCFSGGLEDIEKDPGKYVKECRAFGVDEIMIGTMPTEYRESREGYLRAIERMNAAGRVLAREGILLAYHNHAQEFRRFAEGKTGMDLLFEGLDPSAVHFLLDTHWLQAGGADVLQWIEKCKGRMQYLHVKDYRIAPANYFTGIGETDKQFAQLGDGALPWREIVDTGLRSGVKAFIVEQDSTYGQDPFACAAESYQTLRNCGL